MALKRRRIPTYGPTSLRVQTYSAFTGGLNTRANAFQLEPGETPDCLDVDLQIGGGFLQRKVVAPYGTSVPAQAAQNMWPLGSLSSQQVVMQGADGKIYSSVGTSWTVRDATVRAGLCTAAEFNGSLYIMDGLVDAVRWDGTSTHALGVTWNETIGTEAPHDGNMPVAALCAAHMGRLFLASTVEDSVAYPNRIRWSHAGFPEDWRQEDFIDIDVGRDGDVITAIIEFRERLYIFKNNATYELTGYGPSTFQVVPLAQDIGCVGPLALALTDVGLFTFSWPQGVYLDKGTGPYPIFDKIRPMIRDGFIPSAYRAKIALGYVDQVLWASVPWGTSTVNARTLVYDPWIWKNRYLRFLQGPWYPYTLGISCFATLDTPTSGLVWLGGNAALARVGLLEQSGAQDDWGGGTTQNLTSYYTTNWYDMGQEAVKKRWRHPDLLARTGTSANIQVDVRRNYDGDGVYRTYFVEQLATNVGGLVWDDGTSSFGVWDDGTGMVGDKWNDPLTRGESTLRGQGMGSARSVQLTFTGPVGITWGIDAITLKFVPKALTG